MAQPCQGVYPYFILSCLPTVPTTSTVNPLDIRLSYPTQGTWYVGIYPKPCCDVLRNRNRSQRFRQVGGGGVLQGIFFFFPEGGLPICIDSIRFLARPNEKSEIKSVILCLRPHEDIYNICVYICIHTYVLYHIQCIYRYLFSTTIL